MKSNALLRRAARICVFFATHACGSSTTPADAQPSDGTAADHSALDVTVSTDATSREASVSDSQATDGAVEGVHCDPRRVLCDRVPPACERGQAPSVMGSCWGPCVLVSSCMCSNNEDCPNIPGFSEVCYPTRMRCGPLL
jgi:hypothetical protein